MDVILELKELRGKTFQQWIQELHNNTLTKVNNIVNAKEAFIDYNKLQISAVTYALDSLEVVTNIVYLKGELDRVKEDYQAWYNPKYVEIKEDLEKKGQKSPAITTIEAYIKTKYPEDYIIWKNKIRDIESKYLILDKMEKHWQHASEVYVALIYARKREVEKLGGSNSAISAAGAVKDIMKGDNQ